MKEFILECLRKVIFLCFSRQSKIKKKALFLSYDGKQYSDNPRAISEAFHLVFPDYEIVWYITEEKSLSLVPEYVRVVQGRWLCFLKELSTARVFVTNTQLGAGIFKRKQQFFVQTWHGDVSPKQILYSDENFDGRMHLVIKDKQYTDLCVAGSKLGESVFHKSFFYGGKVLRSGMPRNDALYDEKRREDLRKKFGFTGKKVFLYAPTFRDYDIDDFVVNLDLEAVLDTLGREEWVCVVRGHSNTNGLYIASRDERIFNLSDYPDMTDILCVTDLLITDYSSSASDLALVGRPVVLYQPDIEEFSTRCRKLVYNFEESGFIVAYNMEQLKEVLCNYSFEEYRDSDEKVIQTFAIVRNCKSAFDVCDYIKNKIRE